MYVYLWRPVNVASIDLWKSNECVSTDGCFPVTFLSFQIRILYLSRREQKGNNKKKSRSRINEVLSAAGTQF